MTLDRDLSVRTPEHVGISYQLAGIGNRVLAATIDVVLLAIVLFGLDLAVNVVLLDRVGGVTASAVRGIAILVVDLLIPFVYWILLEAFWNGQTLGKRMVGIRVLTEEGAPVGFFAVLARGLLRILDLVPVIFPVDVVLMLVTAKGQRLGDLVAGTIVVKASFERDFAALRTPVSRVLSAELRPVTVRALSGEQQRLVREFALRETTLPDEVSRPLALAIAKTVRPVVPESADHPDDVAFLRAVAAALHDASTVAASPDH